MTGTERITMGMLVTVRSGPPEAHCRTPAYLRGKQGLVVSEAGWFRDPSKLAFHQPGLPMKRLLRVRFRQVDIWQDYRPVLDTLYADLYDDWLEPQATAGDTIESHANA